ncbi:MAG: histidine kinase [Flavobacteriaceae bacterium]|nr:histidine kinase [Flavobacteriaceae bacterium]
MIVIILVIIYQKNLNKYRNEQLAEQLRTNLLVEHKERARIAKELHDGLCGDLATLNNFVSAIKLIKDKDLVATTIIDIQESVSQCYDEVLRISYNLSPPLIKDNPINLILSSYLIRISRITPIDITFISNNETFHLSELERLEIYRIVQELIQNIIKHSQATYAEVFLQWYEQYMILSIKDNGIKYDFNADLKRQKIGLGLSNIKTRIQQIKAELILQNNQSNNIIQLKVKKQDGN